MFAIKQYQGKWVVVAVCEHLEQAKRLAKGIAADLRREFPLVAPRVIKAAPEVLEAWALVGNQIDRVYR